MTHYREQRADGRPDAPAALERRRFLQLAGLGGAGVLGVAAVGLDALLTAVPAAAATDAIALGDKINSLVVGAHGAGWAWGGRCQQAQYYAEWAARGTESGIATYGTAQLAYRASHVQSTDPAAAPAGSFSYWTYGTDGHVVTNIGNGYCINTSTRSLTTLHDFGHGLRITRIAEQPEPYLGWSLTNGANGQIAMSPWSPGGGSGGGQTWAFNPPDAATQKRIQAALARRGRYSGPIDGAWGVNSIKGIQTTIKNVGYTGAVDGVPGYNTCHYVQVYAQKFGGYTGPVDAVLGPNSWNGFAVGLEKP